MLKKLSHLSDITTQKIFMLLVPLPFTHLDKDFIWSVVATPSIKLCLNVLNAKKHLKKQKIKRWVICQVKE